MKLKILILSIILSNTCFSQVSTVLDSLDNPIAFTFVNDDIYLALHGSLPGEGKIVKFNVSNPVDTYQILFDSLTYPRAIIEQDGILYIGLNNEIVTYDLNGISSEFDTLYQEQFLFPRSFAFNGNDLFFAQQEALSKIDITDTIVEKELLLLFDENPLSITNYNNTLLIAEGNSIHSYDLSSNTLIELIDDLEYKAYSILVIDNYLYLDQGDLSFVTEEILFYDLNDIEAGSELFCNNLGSAIGLNEYQGQIYFAKQKPVFNNMPEGKIQVINKELINSIDQIEVKINIFPNPTNNIINIDTEIPLSCELYNSSGILISRNDNSKQINMSDLPNGLYVLRISTAEGNYLGTKKVIRIE